MPRLSAYLRALAISVLVWIGIDAVFWVGNLLDDSGEEFSWRKAIRGFINWWGIIALFTPTMFALTRRWPMQRLTWRDSAWRLGLCILAMALVSLMARGMAGHFLMTHEEKLAAKPPLPLDLRHMLWRQRMWLPYMLFHYAALAGVGYAVDVRRRLRERELRTQQLENELSRAKLDALKGQLQPHFLFNTLHAIGVTAPHDGQKASRMIVHLGDLLRRTLETHKHQLVPIKEELELLAPYLEIQKLRFADRLSVLVDVPENLLDCLVPSLMLQPIVENAIRHGIEAKAGAGKITIRARAEAEVIVIEVEDDGRGLQSGRYDPSRDGIGLSATRARISKLFDGQGTFALAASRGGGAVARIRMPRLAFPKTA